MMRAPKHKRRRRGRPHPAREPAAPEAAPPRPVVLVVEDQPAIRLLLCDLLESAGLDVDDAEDAGGALELLSLFEADRSRAASWSPR